MWLKKEKQKKIHVELVGNGPRVVLQMTEINKTNGVTDVTATYEQDEQEVETLLMAYCTSQLKQSCETSRRC